MTEAASGGGGKARRPRHLISSGAVHSLLTQHYGGEEVSSSKKLVKSYDPKPLLEHRPDEVHVLREDRLVASNCCLTTQQLRNTGADGFKTPPLKHSSRPSGQNFLGTAV